MVFVLLLLKLLLFQLLPFTALRRINSWSFNSTELRDENMTNNPPPVVPVDPEYPVVEPEDPFGEPQNGVNVLLVGLVVGCVLLVGGLVLVWCICWKKGETGGSRSRDGKTGGSRSRHGKTGGSRHGKTGGSRDDEDTMDKEFKKGAGPRKFSYKTLAQSTGNFDEGNKLGEGGFGKVYKGFIKELDSDVAVKRVSSRSRQGMKEYATEVRIISRLRHRNLVQLIGWCHEKGELLLVYEFMSNGSLDSHLFKREPLLNWEARYRIARGLASGLFYLHEAWEQCVLHRDIKLSNIMLDSNYNAKLGDFGLARLVDHGQEPKTTAAAGTFGYMAPEYFRTGKASKESDIYSFGIVALEICCGRKATDRNFSGNNIAGWVWKNYGEEKVIELADPNLGGHFNEEQMKCLMIAGLRCAHEEINKRPSIQEVEDLLPKLPSKMHVDTNFAPSIPLLNLSGGASSSQGGQSESSGRAYRANASEFTVSSSATIYHQSVSLGV